jgi:hypothetical protein
MISARAYSSGLSRIVGRPSAQLSLLIVLNTHTDCRHAKLLLGDFVHNKGSTRSFVIDSCWLVLSGRQNLHSNWELSPFIAKCRFFFTVSRILQWFV